MTAEPRHVSGRPQQFQPTWIDWPTEPGYYLVEVTDTTTDQLRSVFEVRQYDDEAFIPHYWEGPGLYAWLTGHPHPRFLGNDLAFWVPRDLLRFHRIIPPPS